MDNKLENLIAFDKGKYSETFGKPYLRTKAVAIKELNQSLYQDPSVLDTDKYDWNLRTSEYNKFIPMKATEAILTVPTLFTEKSVMHLKDKVQAEGSYSNYQKDIKPFENTTRSLKKASRKLKQANEYLSWQQRRFHSKGLPPIEGSHECIDQEYFESNDGEFIQDRNSSVFTSNMKQLEDGDDEASDYRNDFEDDGNENVEDGGEEQDAFASQQGEQMGDLPFFIDEYNEDSVAALMKQIGSLQALENMDEDGFLDPFLDTELQHHTQRQRHIESRLKYKSKSSGKLETVKETVGIEDSDVHTDPKKQTGKTVYNPRHQRADPNEDITKLNAKTTFQLTDKITITMGHMDRALYKNSRKFGIKFDEKVQRKREILAREKSQADKIRALLEQNDADYVPAFVLTCGSSNSGGDVGETAMNSDYLIAGIHSYGGNVPSSSSAANTTRYNVPTLPPLTSGSTYLLPSGLPHANTMRADPVSKRVNLFHAPVEEKLIFECPSPAVATTTATTAAASSASINSIGSRHGEDESVCLTHSVATTGQPTSVLFDLGRDGKLLSISLKSEVEVERPKSADALRKIVRDAGGDEVLNERVNSTYRSYRAELAERRRYLKKPKEKKNLMQIDYISEADAQFERQALMYLYSQCNGRHWYNSTNWCTDAPVRTWYGVGLSVEGYVFELDLSDNNLSGEFPDSVSMFSRIESLNLNNNRLRGELPNHALCRMQSLEVLCAENNRLSGEVSFYMLSNLPKLTDLWLGRNNFSGSIGDDIGNMTSLVNLCMYGNKISGCIPQAICKLHRLEFLSLGNNRLTGEVPPQIINLHQLRNLSLHSNQLTGEAPAYLISIPYLEDIELFNNNFTGYVPGSMKELRAHKYT